MSRRRAPRSRTASRSVVEDNGPGIEADLADRVFDYRYRGEVIEDGSGLGLAITRDVVERVGGSVSLREGGEGGARFVVRVPESGAAKDG